MFLNIFIFNKNKLNLSFCFFILKYINKKENFTLKEEKLYVYLVYVCSYGGRKFLWIY